MNRDDYIAKAFDSNAFTIEQTNSETNKVNPEIWNKQVLEHEKANLVVAPLGEQFNDLLGKPGDVLNKTIHDAPSAASAVSETDDVAVDSFTTSQATFTPSEYGSAYEVSRKEMDRAFFSIAGQMSKNLGYQLALKKDSLCISTCTSGAGNSVLSNGKAASSDLNSTDTLDYSDFVSAKKALMLDKYMPEVAVVAIEQYADLIDEDQFKEVRKFGDRVAKKGEIGQIAGMKIYATTQISPSSNTAKALIFGTSNDGTMPFGIAQKRNPTIEQDYTARSRKYEIIAVEDYDVQVLHSNGICTVESYAT